MFEFCARQKCGGVCFEAVRLLPFIVAVWIACGDTALAFQPENTDEAKAAETSVASPNGTLRAGFHLTEEGRSVLAVSRQQTRLATVKLGLQFAKSSRLQDGLVFVESQKHENDVTYSIPVGKTSSAHDHHRELLVSLQDSKNPDRRLTIAIRAFDDGIAFRYHVPQLDVADFVITDELTEFLFENNPEAHLLSLNGFTSAYETEYQTARLQDVSNDTLMGLPLLLRPQPSEPQPSEPLWVAVTEAGLTDYAGMYLQRIRSGAGRSGTGNLATEFVSRLSPLPGRSDHAKVIGRTPFQSPWRVIMIADQPGRLLESDLVFHLNEPSQIKNPSWIQPGKTTFPWWNGYALGGVDFEPGVNTATIKHYIDFCAENGIPYHSLDGLRIAWYGGPIRPVGPVDVTTAVDSIDLPEVLRYAQEKGVRIRLWVHWKALKPQLDEAMATYEKWGVEGIMVDFMNRDDQEMVRWYHEVARKAAKHHLTVTWHGAYKPTGMERTWPNVLSYEAVRNQEYNKWSAKGLSPEHNLNVAFIRSIAGPLDYHQGGMRSVLQRNFQPHSRAPLVLGTRCHQLAMYVVFQNHLSMMADFPSAYRNQPDLKFLVDIPANWDETKIIHAEFGRCIVVARRKDKTWYLGGMLAGKARPLPLPLTFLNSDRSYQVELLQDDLQNAPNAVRFVNSIKSSNDQIEVPIQSNGGFVAKIMPR